MDSRVVVAVGGVMVAALLVSGGSGADPRTPPGLPGLPPPFLGTAVVGSGGLTAAVDAYSDLVDLRVPGPAGRALIDNPAAQQAAGTVPADTGIVPWVQIDGGAAEPLWRADSVKQRYRQGTNVLVTTARFGTARVRIVYAAGPSLLACLVEANRGAEVEMRSDEPAAERHLRCDDRAARQTVRTATRQDRRWLARALPLGADAPPWATQMYERSLLVLRALTDRRSGAVAAGARDGWAYVWPRDASAAAISYAAAGYRSEARQVARFLLGLGLEGAARFHGDGSPVSGRETQGDAIGWVAAASKAAGLIGSARHAAKILGGGGPPVPWRDRGDYWEGDPGDYLGNALASRSDVSEFYRHTRGENSGTPWEGGLVRVAGDPDSGLDSAAAWAVHPFSQPYLYPAVGATLNRLVSQGTTYGLTPGEDWPGVDPWTAPTAWTAWSLAALGEHRQALRLLADLRRAATPAGALPERVDSRTGIPTSTTPLAWSHAFAILALRRLWPAGA